MSRHVTRSAGRIPFLFLGKNGIDFLILPIFSLLFFFFFIFSVFLPEIGVLFYGLEYY